MAKVKYQVFVSSTYEDLKSERDAVMRVILKMGHIPVGMEMFNAADEEQWKTITNRIDESDYYIVVIASRYGSTTSDGVSFTEKEYDYASAHNVPILRFVMADDAKWPTKYVDKGKAATALSKFKAKVKTKQVDPWKSADELQGLVAVALGSKIDTNPRMGWVRPGEAVGSEVTKELSRLSSENSRLREQVDSLLKDLVVEKQREMEHLLDSLKDQVLRIRIRYKGSNDWETAEKTNYHAIFRLIAPEMVDESNTEEMAHLLATRVAQAGRDVRSIWPIGKNRINSILADLSVLDLVEPSLRSRSKTEKRSFWTLTSKGREVFALIRRKKLGFGDVESDEPTNTEDSEQTDKAKTLGSSDRQSKRRARPQKKVGGREKATSR